MYSSAPNLAWGLCRLFSCSPTGCKGSPRVFIPCSSIPPPEPCVYSLSLLLSALPLPSSSPPSLLLGLALVPALSGKWFRLSHVEHISKFLGIMHARNGAPKWKCTRLFEKNLSQLLASYYAYFVFLSCVKRKHLLGFGLRRGIFSPHLTSVPYQTEGSLCSPDWFS